LRSQDPDPPDPPSSAVILAARASVASGESPGGTVHTSILPDLFTGSLVASFQVPLPPGRNGMTPQFDLIYRSNSGRSWLGVGWDLELGAIERKSRPRVDFQSEEYEHRSAAGVVELTRLPDGTFRAKIESAFTKFEKRVQDGRVFWLATDRQGNRHVLGATETARLADPGNPDRIFRWSLERVEDTFGNFIAIAYQKPDGAVPYPASIRYTEHPDIPATHEVQFDLAESPRGMEDHSLGFPVIRKRQLQAIRLLSGGQLQAAYRLEYEESLTTSRPLLARIRRFGRDAVFSPAGEIAGSELPPVEMTYTASARDTGARDDSPPAGRVHSETGDPGEVQWADVNGDGRMDYCRVLEDEISCALSISGGFGRERRQALDDGYPESRAWVDFNGDGRADFCRLVGDFGEFRARCRLATADGFGAEIDSGELVRSEVLPKAIAWVDLNNDGQTDFCRATLTRDVPQPFQMPLNERTITTAGLQSMGFGRVRCLFSRGTSFNPNEVQSVRTNLGQRSGWGWADVDGNGYPDFCRVLMTPVEPPPQPDPNDPDIVGEPRGLGCLLFDGQRFSGQLESSRTDLRPGEALGRAWVDVNGDGLAEYCRIVNRHLRCTVSTGRDLNEGPSFSSSTGRLLEGRFWLDFNGDGLADYCFVDPGSRRAFCRASTGTGFGALSFWETHVRSDERWQRQWADIDGDRVAEYCYVTADSGRQQAHCVDNGSPTPDLLRQMSNGIGGTTRLEYGSSAAFENASLPVPIPVIRRIRRHDGRGTEELREYEYAGGFWHTKLREFRGFRRVSELGPKGSNGERTITRTWFHQGNGLDPGEDDPAAEEGFTRGRPYRLEVLDSEERLLTETLFTYQQDNDGAAPYFNPLAEEVKRICEGGPCENEIRLSYEYDGFGNRLRELRAGGAAGNLTERRTVLRRFAVNEQNWILGALSVEKILAGDPPPSGPVGGCDEEPAGMLFCIENFYDGVDSCEEASQQQTPSRGKLTRTRTWLDGEEWPEVRWAFQPHGELACSRDPRGGITKLFYDPTESFVVRTESPLGFKETSQYYGVDGVAADLGGFGQMKRQEDANGNSTSWEYDVFGRSAKVKGPEDGTTTYRYRIGDPRDQQLRSEQVETGVIRTTYFDGLGRSYATETSGPQGRTIREESQFDGRGLEIRKSLPFYIQNPSLEWITQKFDSLGRLTEQREPNGALTQICYQGWRSASIDPVGRKVATLRDSQGQVVRTEEYLGRHDTCTVTGGVPYAATDLVYDAMGRLVHLRDSLGSETLVAYDALSRKTRLQQPNGATWTYAYDAGGNLIRQVDPLRRETKLAYDLEARLTEVIHQDGAEEVSTRYTYDGAEANGLGRLAQVEDTLGNQTAFAYDDAGRTNRITKTIAGSTFTTTYRFDPLGRLVSHVFPDGHTVETTYSGSLIHEVRSASQSYLRVEDWTAQGQPTVIQHGNGAVTRRNYCREANLRLCGVEVRGPGSELLQKMDLRFDLGGNITAILDPIRGYEWFAYDELGRLATAFGPYGELSQAYDSAGNITFSNSRGAYRYAGPTANTHPYAPVEVGTDQYVYDQIGNESQGPDRSIAYDVAGRIEQVERDRKRTQLLYEGSGSRVRRVIEGKPLWPPKALLRTLTGRFSTLDETVYAGPGYRCDLSGCQRWIGAEAGTVTIEPSEGGTPYYLHADPVGSVRLVTDGSGAAIRRESFTPFGLQLDPVEELEQIPTFFAGLELDREAALYLAGSRYYDPALGRFIGLDMASGLGPDPQTLNPYAYARNNPLIYADPNGENPFLIAFAVGALIGGLQAGMQSGWDGDAVLRGAFIGGIAAGVGAGVGMVAGPILGGAAAGGTGAFLSGDDIGRGIALGILTAGVSEAAGFNLNSPQAGSMVGAATGAVFTGGNVGEAVFFSLAGSATGDLLAAPMDPEIAIEPDAVEAVLTEPVSVEDIPGARSTPEPAARTAQAFEDPLKQGLIPIDPIGFVFETLVGLRAVRLTFAGLSALPRTQAFKYFFGRGGLLNSNRYLRIGIGRKGGDQVFRMGGKVVQKLTGKEHIDIKHIGPIQCR
jgi:RHS repeat-associated protein